MNRLSCPAGALVLVALAGCADAGAQRFASQLANKPAPDFELTALDGGKVRLSELRGKPVVLAFFGFSCPPCRAEAPHLSRLAEQHEKDGLVVLAVNAWDDPKEILRQYVEQAQLKQRVLLNGGEVTDRYGIPDRTVPTIVWVDRKGMVFDADLGSGSVTRLEKTTKSLLAKG